MPLLRELTVDLSSIDAEFTLVQSVAHVFGARIECLTLIPLLERPVAAAIARWLTSNIRERCHHRGALAYARETALAHLD